MSSSRTSASRRSRPFRESTTFRVLVVLFVIAFVLLLLGAGILGLVAMRLFKKGSPPVPTMAIDEAKKTRAAIEEARR